MNYKKVVQLYVRVYISQKSLTWNSFHNHPTVISFTVSFRYWHTQNITFILCIWSMELEKDKEFLCIAWLKKWNKNNIFKGRENLKYLVHHLNLFIITKGMLATILLQFGTLFILFCLTPLSSHTILFLCYWASVHAIYLLIQDQHKVKS